MPFPFTPAAHHALLAQPLLASPPLCAFSTPSETLFSAFVADTPVPLQRLSTVLLYTPSETLRPHVQPLAYKLLALLKHTTQRAQALTALSALLFASRDLQLQLAPFAASAVKAALQCAEEASLAAVTLFHVVLVVAPKECRAHAEKIQYVCEQLLGDQDKLTRTLSARLLTRLPACLPKGKQDEARRGSMEKAIADLETLCGLLDEGKVQGDVQVICVRIESLAEILCGMSGGSLKRIMDVLMRMVEERECDLYVGGVQMLTIVMHTNCVGWMTLARIIKGLPRGVRRCLGGMVGMCVGRKLAAILSRCDTTEGALAGAEERLWVYEGLKDMAGICMENVLGLFAKVFEIDVELWKQGKAGIVMTKMVKDCVKGGLGVCKVAFAGRGMLNMKGREALGKLEEVIESMLDFGDDVRKELEDVVTEAVLGGGSGRFDARASRLFGRGLEIGGGGIEALIHPRAPPVLGWVEEGSRREIEGKTLGKRGREDAVKAVSNESLVLSDGNGGSRTEDVEMGNTNEGRRTNNEGSNKIIDGDIEMKVVDGEREKQVEAQTVKETEDEDPPSKVIHEELKEQPRKNGNGNEGSKDIEMTKQPHEVNPQPSEQQHKNDHTKPGIGEQKESAPVSVQDKEALERANTNGANEAAVASQPTSNISQVEKVTPSLETKTTPLEPDTVAKKNDEDRGESLGVRSAGRVNESDDEQDIIASIRFEPSDTE